MMGYFYYLVLLLSILGVVCFWIINTRKPIDIKKANWLKFFSYLIIINLLFLSIIYVPDGFFYIAWLISAFGLFEIVRALYTSGKMVAGLVALLIYLPLVFGFINFAKADIEVLLFTYAILTIFDAFSQLTGQIFVKTKLALSISPNKTRVD
jgi:phosphatidate cytidylyltransferase